VSPSKRMSLSARGEFARTYAAHWPISSPFAWVQYFRVIPDDRTLGKNIARWSILLDHRALPPRPTMARSLMASPVLRRRLSPPAHRSDLIHMDVQHVTFTSEGVRLLIPRSKSDQTGEGRTIALLRAKNPLYCPVSALMAWISAAKIDSGAIWVRVLKGGHATRQRLTGHAVCCLVKEYASAAGIDPATVGGHSLRSGPLSSAAANGASVVKLKQLSRHKNTDVLVNNYIHPVDIFRDHCPTGLL
jgi:hypothetical protein